MTKAIQYQLEHDEVEIIYENNKRLQLSDSSAKSTPTARTKLISINYGIATERRLAKKKRDRAVDVLRTIAEHPSITTSYVSSDDELGDLQRTIESISAWCTGQSHEFPSGLGLVGSDERTDVDSGVSGTANPPDVLEPDHDKAVRPTTRMKNRVLEMDERVHELEAYQEDIRSESLLILNDSLDSGKWDDRFPRVNLGIKNKTELCQEHEANIDSVVGDIQEVGQYVAMVVNTTARQEAGSELMIQDHTQLRADITQVCLVRSIHAIVRPHSLSRDS